MSSSWRMALHEGKITEMKTGEGKTLVATLAVVLNALSGKASQWSRERLPRPGDAE